MERLYGIFTLLIFTIKNQWNPSIGTYTKLVPWMIEPTSSEAPEMHMLPRSAGYDQKVGHVVNPWSMGR